MAYVPVPKDLSQVKTKVAFNLTKRQLICFGSAGAIGVPIYAFTRGVLGNTGAVWLMIFAMLPAFVVAIYEKDGQPAERIFRNMIRSRYLFPVKRPYKTESFYSKLWKERDFGCQKQNSKQSKNCNYKKTSCQQRKTKRVQKKRPTDHPKRKNK